LQEEAKHKACSLCYSEESKQDGKWNYCPECNKTWCHICNQEGKNERTLFETLPAWCSWRASFPLACEFYHFCRFYNQNGKRALRSETVFYSLAILGGLLWILWTTVYFLFAPFVWALSGVIYMPKRQNPFLLLALSPLIYLLLLVLMIFISVCMLLV